jgi:hypothetical protein
MKPFAIYESVFVYLAVALGMMMLVANWLVIQ